MFNFTIIKLLQWNKIRLKLLLISHQTHGDYPNGQLFCILVWTFVYYNAFLLVVPHLRWLLLCR